MKNIVSLLLALLSATGVYAQLNGDGYYRIKNHLTERYIYVIDDKGSINMTTTSADLYAIILWKGFDKAVSDPATVMYIKKVGDQYDLQSQGTGIFKIIGYYVNIRANSDGTYMAYATNSGLTKYLADSEQMSDVEVGYLTSEGNGNWRKWDIQPINNSNDSSYFGVKSEFSDSKGYYASLYASFPFSFASTGMKAYFVSKVSGDMAVMKEVTGYTKPSSTPLIIKCASDKVSENRLNLQNNDTTALSSSLLKGVYFKDPEKIHYNQLAYDPTTMRILGKMKDGTIGFVKADIDYLPANKAYLVVPTDAPDELRMVTEEEFTAGIDDMQTISQSIDKGVYSISGTRVADNLSSLENLKPGIYISEGKKFVVK
jgi:hypothetical protein